MILAKLAGTDRRSTGRADEVAREIAGDQKLFDEVFEALYLDDPVIRMRAADALEKASRKRPERLYPHKDEILGALAGIGQQEVCWHLAQMLPRLPLDAGERRRAAAVAEAYLGHESAIVRVNALEALVELARGDDELEEKALGRLAGALTSGTAAEKARARKLMRVFGKPGSV